jgi:CRP-like cAMP-binding protein
MSDQPKKLIDTFDELRERLLKRDNELLDMITQLIEDRVAKDYEMLRLRADLTAERDLADQLAQALHNSHDDPDGRFNRQAVEVLAAYEKARREQ